VQLKSGDTKVPLLLSGGTRFKTTFFVSTPQKLDDVPLWGWKRYIKRRPGEE
jgi:hypothetical protein